MLHCLQLQLSLVRLFAASFQGHQLSTCPSPQAIVYNPRVWWHFSNKKQAGTLKSISQKGKHMWESFLRQVPHQRLSSHGQGPSTDHPFHHQPAIGARVGQTFSFCFPLLSFPFFCLSGRKDVCFALGCFCRH